MRKILSIQGGGIRGIIPCCALIELERQLGGLTRDHIDMIAGTSTGALLAACVAAGVPASDALKVYVDKGPEIFSPQNDVERKIKLIATGHMFDSEVLAKVVRGTLPNPAVVINDLPIRVLITAVDMSGDRWFFVKDQPGNAKTTGAYCLADAAVASACATTYHQPWLIPGLGYFFDGGTGGLADPVYHAAVEAFCYDDFQPADTEIISLGTGFYRPPKPPDPPENLLANISWVVSSLIAASKSEAEEAVNRHWPDILTSFNPPLPSEIDEADVSQIPTLLKIGQEAAARMEFNTI